MSPSYARPLTALFQPFQRVLPDCLEHPEVGLAVRVFAASDQVLGDERLQPVQEVDVEIARITEIAGRLGGLHGPSAHEGRELPEETPLVLVEEIVAPGDRVAERLVSIRKIPSPARHELESTLQ